MVLTKDEVLSPLLFTIHIDAFVLGLYTGGAIWGMSWCPGMEGDVQYLCISSHLTPESSTHVYAKEGPGLIQVRQKFKGDGLFGLGFGC